jgi:hypothetical protein
MIFRGAVLRFAAYIVLLVKEGSQFWCIVIPPRDRGS